MAQNGRRRPEFAVAVRSSATAEDLPEASFAGQQETFLNVRGEEHLLACMHEVYASLFNDRAIAYRVHNNFDHNAVALSVGVQHMVRSDLGAPASCSRSTPTRASATWCSSPPRMVLGETVVQGAVNPDEFYVYKPALRAGRRSVLRKNLGQQGDQDDLRRARHAGARAHRRCARPRIGSASRSMRRTSSLWRNRRSSSKSTTARRWTSSGARTAPPASSTSCRRGPETVQSRAGRTILRFTLKSRSTLLVSGRSIGQRIGAGHARVIRDVKEMSRVRAGDVLVADMTDPDWEPVMKRASAIVTNRGGRTCHAAIIARELGIPAVVGCVTATSAIKRKSGGHRLLRRRRYRACVRRHARIRSAHHRTGFAAGDPGQDHDEHRQSRPRFRFCRHTAQRRRPRTSRVHHQSHDRRASAGAAGIRQAKPRTQGDHRQADRGLSRIR